MRHHPELTDTTTLSTPIDFHETEDGLLVASTGDAVGQPRRSVHRARNSLLHVLGHTDTAPRPDPAVATRTLHLHPRSPWPLDVEVSYDGQVRACVDLPTGETICSPWIHGDSPTAAITRLLHTRRWRRLEPHVSQARR